MTLLIALAAASPMVATIAICARDVYARDLHARAAAFARANEAPVMAARVQLS